MFVRRHICPCHSVIRCNPRVRYTQLYKDDQWLLSDFADVSSQRWNWLNNFLSFSRSVLCIFMEVYNRWFCKAKCVLMVLTLSVHQKDALYCIRIKPCQTHNRTVHMSEHWSFIIHRVCIYIYLSITHITTAGRSRETRVRERERKRDHLISGHTATGIVVVTRCMLYQKGSKREREKERKREAQLCLLQFMTREKRTLIPINCSVDETQKSYANTYRG